MSDLDERRAERKGQALLQTAFASHPLMKSLCELDYRALVEPILQERRVLGFPPFSRVVTFVADALELDIAMAHLKAVRELIESDAKQRGCHLVGPIPALMTRRVGRYRTQLSVISADMQALRSLLNRLVPQLASLRGFGKSNLVIEVDPADL